MRLLGIDPGLASTGWGLIDQNGTKLVHVAHGTVRTKPALGLPLRLALIEAEIAEVIRRYRPDRAAVESAFVARDPQAALKLGHARAVALLVPARAGLDVAEYAPNLVKKSLVGAGHAGKEQIRMMVERLLSRVTVSNDHEADALAIAICDAHHHKAAALVAAAR